MNRGTRRVWLTLAVLAGLALTASAASAQWWMFSSNIPDWFQYNEDTSSDIRAVWFSWNTTWVDGRGMGPDFWTQDFEMHPDYQDAPWAWSGVGLDRERVVAGEGIEIPWDSAQPVMLDLTLGNRQLHAWKKWYIELGFYTNGEPANPFAAEPERVHVEFYANKDDGGEWRELNADEVSVIKSGWGTGDEFNVWYAEYYFEPQPDMENIAWSFNTLGLTGPDELRVGKVWTGTTCTPEPVTVVLLALGLPLGLLARRRRKED